MIPANTAVEQEAHFINSAHYKGIEAVMTIPRPKGIRFQQQKLGAKLTAPQRRLYLGITLYILVGFLGYLQWNSWGLDRREIGIFHEFIWAVMGIFLILGTIFNFTMLRIEFRADHFSFTQPILGIGIANNVDWMEIKGIASGAIVGRQGQLEADGVELGGYTSVASVVKVKTPRGILAMGKELSSPHRIYLREALVAYTKAWRATLAEQVKKMQEDQKLSAEH